MHKILHLTIHPVSAPGWLNCYNSIHLSLVTTSCSNELSCVQPNFSSCPGLQFPCTLLPDFVYILCLFVETRFSFSLHISFLSVSHFGHHQCRGISVYVLKFLTLRFMTNSCRWWKLTCGALSFIRKDPNKLLFQRN